MGAAMGYVEGFVKVLVDGDTGKILGAHIIGPRPQCLSKRLSTLWFLKLEGLDLLPKACIFIQL